MGRNARARLGRRAPLTAAPQSALDDALASRRPEAPPAPSPAFFARDFRAFAHSEFGLGVQLLDPPQGVGIEGQPGQPPPRPRQLRAHPPRPPRHNIRLQSN